LLVIGFAVTFVVFGKGERGGYLILPSAGAVVSLSTSSFSFAARSIRRRQGIS
jgi:hypothetical protein